MFASLSERFDGIVKNLTGRGRLTEENIKETLRAIRIALLEADVALPVVKSFIQRVQEKALGEKVLNSLTPGQELTKIVKDELTLILGEATAELTLSKMPPTVILVAGLQGAGKTTTVVKLARFLKEQGKKKVLVTSTDIYRPAAIEQLATLAKQTEIEYFPSSTNQDPLSIAQHAIQEARKLSCDIVIIDTAGRLHVDNEMMQEIKKLHAGVQPTETLFVVDSMTGQDAVHTANAFNDALPLTGVVLTKTDGDARGGAALSVWETIHKPIKFIGTGEKIDQFEIFHPERIATRILGMGDIVSLVEDVHQKIDQKKAEKVAKKLKSGKRFDLEDFLEQLEQMNHMGGISSIISKLPGLGSVPQALKEQVNDKMFLKMKAIIQSMTIKERRFPDLIKGSRKRRIAMGSGTEVQEVNRLLKQFDRMQKMMKKLKKGGMMNAMRQLQGSLPPGGDFNLPF